MTTQKKVLIVEDDRPIGNLLKGKLEKEGFEVLLAEDGEKGLAMALEHKPNVIACDIDLPKLSGPAFVKKLRDDSWGEDSYVFMITNASDSSHVTQMLSLGITTYFVKSDIQPETIIKHIKNYLAKHPLA